VKTINVIETVKKDLGEGNYVNVEVAQETMDTLGLISITGYSLQHTICVNGKEHSFYGIHGTSIGFAEVSERVAAIINEAISEAKSNTLYAEYKAEKEQAEMDWAAQKVADIELDAVIDRQNGV